MENLELRMYGLVPYNISPIQQSIQFGHAVVEYGQEFKNTEIYNVWADKWKTFIILNGGTTNIRLGEDGLPLGTLNHHLLELENNGMEFAVFHEPDLGDQLTAIVFIVDERVFNKEKYPDFDFIGTSFENSPNSREYIYDKDIKEYNEWVESIGGNKNLFLREFLKRFRLA